jgi:DNA-binding NtrC family response regulator
MRQEETPGSKIIIFGLADGLANDSKRILAEQGHDVFASPFLPAAQALTLIEQLHADFVFCDDDPAHYRVLLEAIRRANAGLPLVVVSPQPDTNAWLDALQAGATDFCAPPFESASLRWILESARTSRFGTA